jgi:predicted RNA-binding protein Jag
MEEKISAEAETLYAALDEVAEKLGITREELDYEFDKAHFREQNKNKAVDTVKVFAWKKPEQDLSGVNIGKAWLEKSLGLLDIEATITHKISEKNVSLQLKSEKGALIVGRKGSTLRAIQQVFLAAMTKEAPDWTFRLDVAGGRKDRDDRHRDDRRGGRDRDDRHRDDRRGGRDRDDRRRDDRRGGRDRKNNTAGLEKLAKQLAGKVQESQEIIVMRQTLNAFERRVVHQVVNDVDGVQTESFMDEGVKRIRIKPVATEE